MDLFKAVQMFPVYTYSRRTPKEVTITFTIPTNTLYDVMHLLREKIRSYRYLADKDYQDAGIEHGGDPYKYSKKYSWRHWQEQAAPLTIFLDRLECAVAKALK